MSDSRSIHLSTNDPISFLFLKMKVKLFIRVAVHGVHKESDMTYQLNNNNDSTNRGDAQVEQCENECKSESVNCSVVSNSLRPPWTTVACQALCPRNSPGKNTGVGSHSLFHGIFLSQGSNPGLLYCRQILYHLSHQGSPNNDHNHD